MKVRGGWQRRAQPGLGTLVEVGVCLPQTDSGPAIDAAFACIRDVQTCLSRFDADSDVARFHRVAAGGSIAMRAATRAVLEAAHELQIATGGGFDVSLGSSAAGWRCEGDRLVKLDAAVTLDLGGIAKGYAVDCAIQALVDAGCAAGWVNAGGDLRVFGDVALPVRLRDEAGGGVRDFIELRDGAFATSHFGPASRSTLADPGSTERRAVHASVAAPSCLCADALTKWVALTGDASHALLARYDAVAWIH